MRNDGALYYNNEEKNRLPANSLPQEGDVVVSFFVLCCLLLLFPHFSYLQLCGQTDCFGHVIVWLLSHSLESLDINYCCVWLDQQPGRKWALFWALENHYWVGRDLKGHLVQLPHSGWGHLQLNQTVFPSGEPTLPAFEQQPLMLCCGLVSSWLMSPITGVLHWSSEISLNKQCARMHCIVMFNCCMPCSTQGPITDWLMIRMIELSSDWSWVTEGLIFFSSQIHKEGEILRGDWMEKGSHSLGRWLKSKSKLRIQKIFYFAVPGFPKYLCDFVFCFIADVFSVSLWRCTFENTWERITASSSCFWKALIRNIIYGSPEQLKLPPPPFTCRLYVILLIPFWHHFLGGLQTVSGFG